MKKICVVTGTRSEYGLLYPLLKKMVLDPEIELQIVATGMHLSPEFGMTVNSIEADGFQIADRIEILMSSDTPIGISKSIGLGNISFAESFSRLNPDMIVLLGDRYEILAAATVANILRIPISHIHGGETTEGAYDEAIRHSITKMSWLHFTSTEDYRRRVIQLGENPERVFHVGALGIENIFDMELFDKKQLEESLEFKIDLPLYLVTYHPVTLEDDTSRAQFNEILSVLENQNASIIFTKANSDNGGRIINNMIDEFVFKHPKNSKAFATMGQQRYLSAMNIAALVMGNSSSGIIEAPSFNIPIINIGDRQKGRVQAKSVINCEPIKNDIIEAINLSKSNSFTSNLEGIVNPYAKKNVSENIIKEIKKALSEKITLKKSFYDII